MTRTDRPAAVEFSHDTMSGDNCQASTDEVGPSGVVLVCHLLSDHEGEHWDDSDGVWWTEVQAARP